MCVNDLPRNGWEWSCKLQIASPMPYLLRHHATPWEKEYMESSGRALGLPVEKFGKLSTESRQSHIQIPNATLSELTTMYEF